MPISAIILNFILPLHIGVNRIYPNSPEELWLGYCGTILASAFGAIATIFVLGYTIKHNNHVIKENKKEKFYSCLSILFSTFEVELIESLYYYISIYDFKSLQETVRLNRNKIEESFILYHFASCDVDRDCIRALNKKLEEYFDFYKDYIHSFCLFASIYDSYSNYGNEILQKIKTALLRDTIKYNNLSTKFPVRLQLTSKILSCFESDDFKKELDELYEIFVNDAYDKVPTKYNELKQYVKDIVDRIK